MDASAFDRAGCEPGDDPLLEDHDEADQGDGDGDGSRADRADGALELHAVIRATDPGTYTIAASGIGRYRLSLDGKEVLDEQLEPRAGADIVEGLVVPPQACYEVHLARGEESEVVLSHVVGSTPAAGGGAGVAFQLGLQPPHRTDDEEIERAVALAREADVAIVIVGTRARASIGARCRCSAGRTSSCSASPRRTR